jgi:Apea-like HEPN
VWLVAKDAVLDALCEAAVADLASVYRSEQVAGVPMPELMRMWDHSPSKGESLVHRAVEAMRGDPDLAALVSDEEIFVSSSTGAGWRLQRNQIPGVLIHAAARHVLVSGGSTEAVDPLVYALRDVLVRVRRLVAGDEDTSIILIAFQGISLDRGTRVALPWGELRSASEFEMAMRPFGNPAPTVILERSISLRLRLGEPPTGDDSLLSSDVFAKFADYADRLCLAMALTLDTNPAPRWFWQTVLTPLALGMGFRGKGVLTFGFIPPPSGPMLTITQQKHLVRWSERVDRYSDPSIGIAMHRILSSGHGKNVEDSLIDAVIAWENLFGHGGSTETTFRVTTALAILLEDEPAKRLTLSKELKKIYHLRSKVAHGDYIKPTDGLDEKRDRAREVAIQALRVLFEQRPDLIADKDRGMKLILGVAIGHG